MTHAKRIDAIELNLTNVSSDIAELKALIQALVTAAPAPAPAPAKAAKGKATPAKGKAAKADKDAEAKKAAHAARKAAIAEAVAESETHTWAQALKLATARVKHNRAQGFVNTGVMANAPESARVYLTSAENKAFMAARKRLEVKYADSEQALAKALIGR